MSQSFLTSLIGESVPPSLPDESQPLPTAVIDVGPPLSSPAPIPSVTLPSTSASPTSPAAASTPPSAPVEGYRPEEVDYTVSEKERAKRKKALEARALKQKDKVEKNEKWECPHTCGCKVQLSNFGSITNHVNNRNLHQSCTKECKKWMVCYGDGGRKRKGDQGVDETFKTSRVKDDSGGPSFSSSSSSSLSPFSRVPSAVTGREIGTPVVVIPVDAVDIAIYKWVHSKPKKGVPVPSTHNLESKDWGPIIPFVFRDDIRPVMQRNPIAVLRIPQHQRPLVMSYAHRPANMDVLIETPWPVWEMKVQEFNLPNEDKEDDGVLTSFADFQKASVATVTAINESNLHDLLLRPGGALTTKYLNNISLDLWGMALGTSKRPSHHYLNTNLFANHKRSLLSLIPDRFAGVTDAYCYLKTINSVFRIHIEPMFFDSYNYCWQGGSIWWFVKEEDLKALQAFVVDRVRRVFGLRHQLTEDEERLCMMLLYSRQLMFSPQQMIDAGVPLTRVEQTEGMIVMTRGYVFHQGIVMGDGSIQEAINFVGADWLTHGLPRLVSYLEDYIWWVHKATSPSSVDSVLFKLCYSAPVPTILQHEFSPVFAKKFIKAILKDLSQPMRERKVDYSAVKEDYLVKDGKIWKDLEAVIAMLGDRVMQKGEALIKGSLDE
jgi:hypothetical protein